ncbi:6633_t:CDS:1 [Acaulospora colombiana]|uniref:6633_t:CDS:1 n=1 Tax=Acaulospora colombiana TaxID=27376 RepID=A0ACA9KN73_9GLOM|nr:6633_t:CDS:1 [Acaulospora colombiana]
MKSTTTLLVGLILFVAAVLAVPPAVKRFAEPAPDAKADPYYLYHKYYKYDKHNKHKNGKRRSTEPEVELHHRRSAMLGPELIKKGVDELRHKRFNTPEAEFH